jgi:hypothetical protein
MLMDVIGRLLRGARLACAPRFWPAAGSRNAARSTPCTGGPLVRVPPASATASRPGSAGRGDLTAE